MKHSRQCFIGYPNTSNFIKTPLRVVFSTLFSVFGSDPDEALSVVFDILLKGNSCYLKAIITNLPAQLDKS